MKNNKWGLTIGINEHLLGNKPITRLEAIILYGVSNLTGHISELRKSGWIINSRYISYAKALRRVNDFAHVRPPADLPIKDIQVIEYWVSI